MRILDINWLDLLSKEAELKVSDGVYSVICFSCPCNYEVGDILNTELEMLNICNVVVIEEKGFEITKEKEYYAYRIKGKISDNRSMIVIGGLRIHVESYTLPKDVLDGDFVEAKVNRFDVW